MTSCKILVPDNAMKQVLFAFASRPDFHAVMGISSRFVIESVEDILQVPGETDGGVWKHGHLLLRPFRETHDCALVFLDAAWSGAPAPRLIHKKMSNKLNADGWRNRHHVIVVNPELEQLLWQDHPVVEDAFRYAVTGLSLRGFLAQANRWPEDKAKPTNPKGAVEYIEAQGWGIKRTPAYVRIASSVPVPENPDPAFIALRSALQSWFPAETKQEAEA